MKTLLRNLIPFCVFTALLLLTLAQEDRKARFVIIASASQSVDKGISVGANVQVSKALGNYAHYEVLLAADAKNPNNLLGGSMVFSEETNKYSIVAYASFDGGQTWAPTLTADEFSYHFDPTIAYGPDGAAYFVYGAPTSEYKYHKYVYRSKDGGKNWLPRIMLPNGSFDRFFLAIDDTGGKYHGRIYIGGVGGAPTTDSTRRIALKVYRSSDNGATFGGPAQLISEGDRWIFGNGPGVVLSDGTLVYLFGEFQNVSGRSWGFEDIERRPSKPNAWMKVAASDDGGETFSKAVTISDLTLYTTRSAGAIPYLAADRSSGPFKDRLYAVYTDARSGRCDIMFSYSYDKGKNWSKPAVVNDDSPPIDLTNGPDHFMPVVAVNREGVIGVMWYDRRDSPNNLDWAVRFTASLDGGETFMPSVKVSAAPFTHGRDGNKWVTMANGAGGGHNYQSRSFNAGPLSLELGVSVWYFKGGDTAGMAADANGVFHPFWVDNRTGISQVWTAPVIVKGKAMRNGGAGLADLEDVSNRVVINYTRLNYDRLTNTVSVDARLENVSDETLIGPLKARVISLKSDAGAPTILTTDNQENGVGVVWDFTPLLTENRLKPKQRLGVKRLEFRLSDLRQLESLRPSRDWALLQFVRVEARVLGVVQKEFP